MRQNDSSDLLSDDDKPDYHQIMKEKLTWSKNLIQGKYPSPACDIITAGIKHIMEYKEDKIFTMYAADPIDFFNTQWNFVSQRLPLAPLDFKTIIESSLNKRLKFVLKDLEEQKLTIEQPKTLNVYSYDIDEKNGKMVMLKGQSQQIKRKLLQINSSLQSIDGQSEQGPVATNTNTQNKDIFAHLYTEQKKKEVEAFIKKKREEKQQRRKKLELQKQKQEQELLDKQKQMKQIEERQQKLKRQQFLKKNMELHQKRNQQKALREQKSQEYEKHIKSLNQKPRLFQLLQKNYEKKIEYQQMERKHRMMSEKKSRYLNIDELKIEEHEKNYQELKKMKAQQRQKKQEEHLEQLSKNHVKHHSSFELTREVDKQIVERERAKQKFEKIKHYQSIVKQKYKPKVDQQKKKEMITLIEELQLNSKKKLKKTKLENGAIVYEEIRQSDPRTMGMMYLEMTKEMAAKAKTARVANSAQIQTTPVKKKPLNYLEQLRKNSKPRTVRKLSFSDRPNMSFDDKVNNVLLQSQKLNDLVKQNQMKLKYGKFKTSQQILNCKQEIDQSYLHIAKMKLKLIKDQ